MSTCTACHDNPVHDTFVCTDCADILHGDLARIPEVAAELHTEIAKLVRKGQPGPRVIGREQPLPVNLHASTLLDELRTQVVAAVRVVALDQPDDLPRDTIAAMADWLADREHSIALRPEGGDIAVGLHNHLDRCLRTIDTPAERVYIGDCVCGTDEKPVSLYAPRGARMFRCRGCGTGWDVAERLEQLHEECRDQLVTLSEAASILRLKLPRLQRWRDRGRIMRYGVDDQGAHTFRYGDILDTLDAS